MRPQSVAAANMKKFIITGIQMKNKGSQAMFLTLSNGLKEHFPGCDVIGFANKYQESDKFSFELLPYDDFTRLMLNHGLYRVPLLVPTLTFFAGLSRKTSKWNGKTSELVRALSGADAIFDASGYTLGSGWPMKGGELLLDTIRLAKRFNKKIVLMPQSFGPFDWKDGDVEAFLKRAKEELRYCTKIYAREKEGYECLLSLGLDNVELSADMVIREKEFPTSKDIYVKQRDAEIEYPPEGAVGLILNENVFRIGEKSAVLDLYVQIVDRLVANGENVYILNTSTADTYLVDSVLNNIKDSSRVGVISGEYESPELIDIIGRFKYVVASRYHSVVFAYRSGVPAIILGWASKYTDLAEAFHQDRYVFDIRGGDLSQIFVEIDRMGEMYNEESQRIADRLTDVQSSSVIADAIRALEAK
jgi:polysaccharide pyruvyl transferase WcaK-like protein